MGEIILHSFKTNQTQLDWVGLGWFLSGSVSSGWVRFGLVGSSWVRLGLLGSVESGGVWCGSEDRPWYTS